MITAFVPKAYNSYNTYCDNMNKRSVSYSSEEEEALALLKETNAIIEKGTEKFIDSVNWNSAVLAVGEGIEDTLNMKKRIDKNVSENIPADAINSLGVITAEDSENIYDWLSDYNADGVKDILDYNIWKSFNSSE